MINIDNHNIIEISYNNHKITRVYGCDGRLVFGEEPQPPVYTDKLTYSISGNTYIMPCDSSSTITLMDVMYDLMDNGYSMADASAMTSVVIGGCVHTISASTFTDSYSLTSATIPNTVTSIGNQAFYDCTTLKSITIPRGVTTINQSVFGNNYELSGLTLSDRTTTIGTQAFYDCLSLIDITIPSSVTSIGDSAFRANYWTEQPKRNMMLEMNENRVIKCLATTPPTIGDTPFAIISGGSDIATYKIQVLEQSVDAYKAAWAQYASRIEALV